MPAWGAFKSRTRPAPGNHDYNTSGASGYYGYFGSQAGPSGQGYYSYNIGNWHIVSLNSNISMTATAAQVTWLRNDLAANARPCTLAYWHHPLFTSGANHARRRPLRLRHDPAQQPGPQQRHVRRPHVHLAHQLVRLAVRAPGGQDLCGQRNRCLPLS
ncbi:hypothetical protein AB0J74_03055 [Asanoa sp. NPDC049573]|uniref:metallophosphoesterase family protein n=1 Tax=Asanoa sp. NPDC049573 TaxID=3155396 RepID=UPI003433A5AD